MSPSRKLGSRNPSGRPRKIASQTHAVEEGVDEPVVEPAEEEPAPPGPPEPPDEPEDGEGGGGRGAGLTIALVVAIVLLVGVGIGELVYLNRDDTPTVSPARPVVVGDATRAEAVETAARSTEEILSTTYDNYDDQVQQATQKMTDAFAEQYQQTADGIRDRFIAQRTRLQVKAVGQSVVQASPAQVQALLFLNQYVEKTVDGQPKTDFAQYRALVTVVHTDHGWLVSSIDTQ
jgi:Mce-associated membrane protein